MSRTMATLLMLLVGVLPLQARADDDTAFTDLVARTRPSVVAIGIYNRNQAPTIQYLGTGFVVAPPQPPAAQSPPTTPDGVAASPQPPRNNVVATNAHVIASIRGTHHLADLRVFFPDSPQVEGAPARLLVEDSFHDVALLRFEGPPAQAMVLELDRAPRQGQRVAIMGYPIGTRLGLVPAVHAGVIAAVVPAVLPVPRGVKLTPELSEAIRRPYNLYQLDMVVLPGNSGSPLFDPNTGRVIGIINKALATRTREHLLEQPSGIAYAVPVRWVYELLVRSGVIDAGSEPDAPGSR